MYRILMVDKERSPHTPVMIMTAIEEEDVKSTGEDAHMAKPFRLAALTRRNSSPLGAPVDSKPGNRLPLAHRRF